jgi:phosphoribosylanthranilate isomerase
LARIATKICGLKTSGAVDVALGGGAAWLGFVFFPRSPRDVAPEAAAGLIAPVPAGVGKVGVFVDPEDGLVARAVAAGITVLQLHGAELPERVAALRARFGLETWKAIAVRARADLDQAARYRGAADRLLYDAKPPQGADLPGGLGMRFDWRLLEGFAHPLPWLLSGGLDAANLAEAVGVTSARAVDVSSGVESAPGVKDVDKIAAFLQSAGRL